MDNALILFSRLPIGRETKTRLSPLLSAEERERLHLAMWADVFASASALESMADIFLYWTGSGRIEDYSEFIPSAFHRREQRGGNLGERMRQAMREAFDAGYMRVALMGTDVPSVTPANLRRAFGALNEADIVLGPSPDGGYWLVAMGRFIPEAFSVSSWGGGNVLRATVEMVRKMGLSCALADELSDIDTPDDVRAFLSRPSARGRDTRECLLEHGTPEPPGPLLSAKSQGTGRGTNVGE